MKCDACADPRPDCMGPVVEGIGNRCGALRQAMSEGTASAQRINAAPLPVPELTLGPAARVVSDVYASAQRINATPMPGLPVRCEHFPVCTYPEGQCAELCLPGGLKP
jgi:hypothetical protein